ncbi:hypothetical protein, conserved [Leishmania tarentolae]|uniref:RING-CH-type domain-containing protein n=1 Tax=Leishmania tarentolae TaxID=5689 RepID=A0A640KQ39_LEITA|nr:hypothetical protein, conserved [Leishmania tarentolae]
MTQFHVHARENAVSMRSSVSGAISTALLSLLVVAACVVTTPIAATPPVEAEDRQGTTQRLLGSATAAKMTQHQTSVLGQFEQHRLENDFLHPFVGEPLIKGNSKPLTNIAVEVAPPKDLKREAEMPGPHIQSTAPMSPRSGVRLSASLSPQEQLVRTTQGSASNGSWVSKLNLVYTASVERINELLTWVVAPANDGAVHMPAPQQNSIVESSQVAQPLTPLKEAAQAFPMEALRSDTVRVATSYLNRPNIASQRWTGFNKGAEKAVRAVTEAIVGHGTVKDGSSAKVPAFQKGDSSLPSKMGSYVKNELIYVNSTSTVIPITILGGSTTVVKFNGKADNMIKVVVQLKDHRYDKSVRRDNCYGMYLQVELRGNSNFSGGTNDSAHKATVVETTQAHAYAHRTTWMSMPRSVKNIDADESNRPDIPIQEEGSSSWSDFWYAFTPLLDSSAMCKTLQSVSMRVEKVPVAEPYYIVLQSITVPSFQTQTSSTNKSGSYTSGWDDAPSTCELNIFLDEEPAERLKRLQLIFGLVLPLMVLFLPLPFTMWRADLVQQYMMESDLAEWVWMLPFLLRKKMVEGVKAGIEWILSFRTAYQQRVLRNQLLRQEQAYQGTVAAQSATEQEQLPQQIGEQHVGRSAAAQWAPPLETPGLTGFPASASEDAQTRQQNTSDMQRQLSEEGSFSTRSSRSSCSKSSRACTESDFDESHDSARYHHHRHHTRGRRNVGAVMAPRSACSSDALMEDVSCITFTAGRTHCTRRHRHHTRESHASFEPVTAVSVHIPPGTDAVDHLPQDNQSGLHARRNGHDLLFTTEELFDAGRSLPTPDSHQHAAEAQRSTENDAPQNMSTGHREEVEAMKSCEAAVDGVLISGTSVPVSVSIPAPSEAAVATCGAAPVSATAGAAPDEEEEESFCRICREGSDVAPLIIPCACTGSVRFVHATCLDRWRIESAKRNLSNVNHCEICKEPFRVNIQRSTLLWENSQQILSGVCMFLACLAMIVTTTVVSRVVLGEMSCSASYHQVDYASMFRLEGISLTLFVYCLAVLLMLFANIIVYSWFRSQPDVEEYVEEMHIIPPFYTRRNVLSIVLVSVVLLAQAHAMGYLIKYILYKTSRLVWNWETSPLMGGIFFSIFTIVTTSFFSGIRETYMVHGVHRSRDNAQATDVVIVPIGEADRAAEPEEENSNDNAVSVPLSRSIIVAGIAASRPPSPLPSPATPSVSPSSPEPPTTPGNAAQQRPEDGDLDYTEHFRIPPDQRVIRAFEYCPPRRKMPQR